jgi:signal transduction histidine kinase
MFRTLRARLIVAFASVTLVSLLVAMLGFLLLIRDREVSAARERVGQLVDPVAWSVGNLAQEGASEEQIAQFLDERARTLQVRFLLLDSNERILEDSGRQLVGQTVDMSKQSNLQKSGGQYGFAFVTEEVAGTRQVLFQPSPFSPAQFVTVPNVVPTRYQILMLVPEQDLSEVWRQLAQRMLVAAGAGLLLTFALAALISRSIVLPLARMTRASEEMAHGHYDQRIESDKVDEIGRLAAAFNAMATQVNRSDQMMRDLLANVAHELKTPLTSIQGFSQALTEGAVHSQDDYERAGRIINEEADRMRRLVEDLLYLSQIESGQVAMEHLPVDVRRLLQNSIERISRRATLGGQTLELAAPENLPPVVGDVRRLEQVLGNLLDNALRYTPRDGYIRLAAWQDDGRVTISVHNTGSYIPAEDRARVFERFYRVERSRSGRNGGLGLSIVSEIVAAHGGTVEVQSSPDSGTEFRVLLPAAAATPALLPALSA